VFVKQGEVEHGLRAVLGGGLLVPFACLGIVLRHALTVLVKLPKIIHGIRVAAFSGLRVPFACLGIVLRHARTVLIKPAEAIHSGGIPFIGGLRVPFACLGIVLRLTKTIKRPEGYHRSRIPAVRTHLERSGSLVTNSESIRMADFAKRFLAPSRN